jgi:hypothetical protein
VRRSNHPLEEMMEDLHKDHYPHWINIASEYSNDPENLVQAALLRIWEKRDRFEWIDPWKTHLMIKQEIKWMGGDERKAWTRRVSWMEIPIHLHSLHRTDESDYWLYGEQLRDRLKRHKRGSLAIYFDLHYLQDLTYDEIIQEKGFSRTTLFNRFSEIRKLLKDELTT